MLQLQPKEDYNNTYNPNTYRGLSYPYLQYNSRDRCGQPGMILQLTKGKHCIKNPSGSSLLDNYMITQVSISFLHFLVHLIFHCLNINPYYHNHILIWVTVTLLTGPNSQALLHPQATGSTSKAAAPRASLSEAGKSWHPPSSYAYVEGMQVVSGSFLLLLLFFLFFLFVAVVPGAYGVGL